MLDIVLKKMAPLRKLFTPNGVPSLLRDWFWADFCSSASFEQILRREIEINQIFSHNCWNYVCISSAILYKFILLYTAIQTFERFNSTLASFQTIY